MSQKYIRLAHACSLIYLMLHHLDEVHFLYNYSLEFLMDMFTSALNSPQLTGVKEYDARLSTILQSLFSVIFFTQRIIITLQSAVLIVISLKFRLHMREFPKECSIQIKFFLLYYFCESICTVERTNHRLTTRNSNIFCCTLPKRKIEI